MVLFILFDGVSQIHGVKQKTLVQFSQPNLSLATVEPTTMTQFLPLIFSGYRSPIPSVFGAQMYRTLDEDKVKLSAAWDAGVYWVRWPLSWRRVEPENVDSSEYQWAKYDLNLWNVTEAGLQPIVTIVNNPDWAATYTNGPIDKVELLEFTDFIGALVERYDGDGYLDALGSPSITHWEFYNEPDAGVELNAQYGASYWGPFGEDYAEMLCAVYPVIKSANPHAQIVFGGIAYDSFLNDEGEGGFVREFLDDVLAAGGGDCFDIMNFHYYPPFEAVWAPYGPGLTGKTNYIHTKLAEYGIVDSPMMVTESGWHSEDYSVFPSTPDMQSQYVVKLFTQALAVDIDALTWWTWIDPGGGYGPNGLLTEELEPKPSYYAYQEASSRLGRVEFIASLSLGDQSEGYHFVNASGRSLYVLWANDDASHQVSLPLSKANIVNMYGEEISSVSDPQDGNVDGKVQVNYGYGDPLINPVYVEEIP
jgi:hypothetical protein